jgi:hypothetical protein
MEPDDRDYSLTNNLYQAEGAAEAPAAPDVAEESTDAEIPPPQATEAELTETVPEAVVEVPPDPDEGKPYTMGQWHGLPKWTCRTCGVSFLTEAEFWDHAKAHVPAEQQAEAMRVLIFGPDGVPISRP